MLSVIGFLALRLLVLVPATSPDNSIKPNIVLILTDDQDAALGGAEPLEQGRKLLADAGAEFVNAYATTPICCPSRASILTGRYLHNTGGHPDNDKILILMSRGQEQLRAGGLQ